MIRDGQVSRPAIGVSYLDTSQAKSFGINSGILVLDVQTGSSAEISGKVGMSSSSHKLVNHLNFLCLNAGLRGTKRRSSGEIELGDIIIGINEDKIDSEQDLFKAVEKHNIGEKVRLKVLRASQSKSINAKAGDVTSISLIPLDIELTLTQKVQPPPPMQRVSIFQSD